MIKFLWNLLMKYDKKMFIGVKYPCFDSDGKIYQGMIFKEDEENE
jgi:hypothetical protein